MYKTSVPQLLLVLLCFIGFLTTLITLVMIGQRRRAAWTHQIQYLSAGNLKSTPAQIRSAHQARRASGIFTRLLQHIYCGITITVVVSLFVFIQLPFSSPTQVLLWLVFSSLGVLCGVGVLVYWRSRDEDLEHVLREQHQLTEEQALSIPGMTVRDPVTGLYSTEFWHFALRLPFNKSARHQPSTFCLMIEVDGWDEFAKQHDPQEAQRILSMIGTMITQNVRFYDLVCRYDEEHFAIALRGCPEQFCERVAERVATNLTRLVLDGVNQQFGSDLEVKWGRMTSPAHRPTPKGDTLTQATVR